MNELQFFDETNNNCNDESQTNNEIDTKGNLVDADQNSCFELLVNDKKEAKGVYPYINDAGKRKASLWTRFVKRSFDFCSSFCLFLILNITLIFPILTLIIAIKMKGSPFFIQKRPGKDGKIFSLIKFRTMTNERDEEGNFLPDDVRLTKFGKMLRSTSLDELPELINIILGQMSVVGPRPQLVRDMVFFSDDAMRRQSVRGGLTGLAQISGRNNVSWEDKFDYDLEYIDNYGLIYDLKVIFRTVKKVANSEDIATEGMETAEDYGEFLLRTGAIDKDLFDQQNTKAKQILADCSEYNKTLKHNKKINKSA